MALRGQPLLLYISVRCAVRDGMENIYRHLSPSVLDGLWPGSVRCKLIGFLASAKEVACSHV